MDKKYKITKNSFLEEKLKKFDKNFKKEFVDTGSWYACREFYIESLKEFAEKMKETQIEKAHTYASENAEEYRIFDAGQERFKQIIDHKIAELLKGASSK